jgi:hypothetical protein
MLSPRGFHGLGLRTLYLHANSLIELDQLFCRVLLIIGVSPLDAMGSERMKEAMCIVLSLLGIETRRPRHSTMPRNATTPS